MTYFLLGVKQPTVNQPLFCLVGFEKKWCKSRHLLNCMVHKTMHLVPTKKTTLELTLINKRSPTLDWFARIDTYEKAL